VLAVYLCNVKILQHVSSNSQTNRFKGKVYIFLLDAVISLDALIILSRRS
jgi:hypothetical protein